MDPEPLVGTAPDGILDDGCKAGGVVEGIVFVVAGGNQGDLGTEAQDILVFSGLPDEKSRQDGSAGAECNPREAGCGAGRDTEKWDKDALGRGHIRVHQNADSVALAHGSKETAREVVLVNDAVAMKAADAIDEGVDAGVVEAPDDHGHGIAHQRVPEAGELPGAEMTGDDEDAAPAVAGGKVMIEAVVADEATGVLAGVAGHPAKLGQLPAEVAVHVTEKPPALRARHGGECQFEIAETGTAQIRNRKPGDHSETSAKSAGERAGQHAEAGKERADECVFQKLSHQGAKSQCKWGAAGGRTSDGRVKREVDVESLGPRLRGHGPIRRWRSGGTRRAGRG